MANEVTSTLNGLIETLKDGTKGFDSAAGAVKDASVKGVFQKLSQQRSQFAGELQAEVSRLGGEPEQSGSAVASMHRGWIDLKSAMGGGEKSILNEAERGEDAAVKSYEKALQEPLPANIAGVVRCQFDEVKKAHDQVRGLRDTWK